MLLCLGLVLLPLAVIVTWSWQTRYAPTRVPLANGRELRILKVSLGTNHSYSTEPWWKQGLRWVLPESRQRFLGPSRTQRILARYDSLVIWIEAVHSTGGHLAAPKLEQIKARLPDGSWVEGTQYSVAGGVTGCFAFRCFDRAAREVPLQFLDGTNIVLFTVNNPQPSLAASWTARPLPQTNQIFRTQVILSRLSRTSDGFRANVVACTTGEGQTGWMYWRATGFDPSGNWANSGWYEHFSPYLPMLSIRAAPWKLRIEGKEFISLGRVPSPTQGTYAVCMPPTRAQELGVLFVMVADHGRYAITNGIVTRLGRCNVKPVRPTASATWTGNTNWSLQLVMPEPGLFCVSDQTAGFPVIQARLRERPEPDGGRIFQCRIASDYHVVENRQRTLSFFPIRLPPDATNLEAEIIAIHPATEFFVNPPSP